MIGAVGISLMEWLIGSASTNVQTHAFLGLWIQICIGPKAGQIVCKRKLPYLQTVKYVLPSAGISIFDTTSHMCMPLAGTHASESKCASAMQRCQ